MLWDQLEHYKMAMTAYWLELSGWNDYELKGSLHPGKWEEIDVAFMPKAMSQQEIV